MGHYVTASIFRYDPESDRSPRYDEFRVPVKSKLTVLMLLDRIQKEIDPTLSFRNYCCGLQMCRSCVMKVDRKKCLACITLVKPGDRITVEPFTFPEGHIKDLVVQASNREDEYEEEPQEVKHDFPP